MVARIAHRGPDGIGTWTSGRVALGHAMLHTTLESLQEDAPLATDNGAYAITSDARIDNREELLTSLAGKFRGGDELVPDSALILAAYKEWGDRCVDHLVGDFAFAIFDSARGGLFCARDHFGIKPFYYAVNDDRFAFATEQKALLSLNFVDSAVNDARVEEFVVDLVADRHSSFYKEIFRLPPANSLFVSESDLRIEQYWKLNPDYQLDLASESEYVARFRELFVQAVNCRLRAATPVGSFLSGGLDSSSITCVAAAEMSNRASMLQTVSAVFPQTPECDETSYISEIREGIDVLSHLIDCSDVNPLGNLPKLTRFHDEPVPSLGMYRADRLLEQSAAHGIRIMLDGFDGDSTISHGHGRLTDLAKAGRWKELWMDSIALASVFGWSATATFWGYVEAHYLRQRIDRNPVLRFGRRVWLGIKRRAKKLRKTTPPASRWSNLRTELASDGSRLHRTIQSVAGASPALIDERHMHAFLLTQPLCVLILESLDKTAAANGVEMRYPFWDKRLVEFCLSIPAQLKIGKGWTRLILREAMAGTLPDQVVWRRDKTDFAKVICKDLHTNIREIDVLFDKEITSVATYLNVDAVRSTLAQFKSEPDILTFDCLYPTIALATWLSIRESDLETIPAIIG